MDRSDGMKNAQTPLVEVYIGAPIQHESERSTLREIVRLLVIDGCSAIVFANFTIHSRQIDLLIALKESVLVVEAKTSNRPIRGNENGFWQVRLASGQWKYFPNPYLQALNAALAVKDEAASVAGSAPGFVHAVLVYSPKVPNGSQITRGDRKVSVIGHDGLSSVLQAQDSRSWTGEQWRYFAKHLHLQRVSSVGVACDAQLAEAEAQLRQYAEQFGRVYGNAASFVPFSCDANGEAISSEKVMHLDFDQCIGHILEGPSGCGKSILAESSGAAFSRRGGVAINFQAKHFDGSVREALDREVCLLGAQSASRLLNDAGLLGRPLLFIVDGYNECARDKQRLLTRGIAGLAYRYEAGILVTSQIPLARGDLLSLQRVHVPSPTMETKVAIAKQASEGRVEREKIQDLLAAVSSGLEARLVGEVGATIPRGSSRYGLFDAFARKRLEGANECIGALAAVAAWLQERFTFSISVRDLDRLLERTDLPPDLGWVIQEKGLLTVRGDRVSFPHEMFLDAFAAEAVVRRAGTSPEAILSALAEPLHSTRKDLVIGAIDDHSLLEKLLPKLSDYSAIKACLEGRCGIRAQEWAKENCRTLWGRLREEVRSIRFRIASTTNKEVEFDEHKLVQWTACDRAFFGILEDLLADGCFLEEALETIGVLDQRIASEWLRLRATSGIDEAKLRTELFAISYVYPQGSSASPGISAINRDLQSGIHWLRSGRLARTDDAASIFVRDKLIARDLSPGQLLLFLKLGCVAGTPASFFTRTIRVHWDNAPYHLRFELIECAGLYAEAVNDTEKAELIETIEALLRRAGQLETPILFEALQRLGALDEDAKQHEEGVLERVRKCLASPTRRDSQADAWYIYSAQFDHPYSQAYSEVVASLEDADRKKLLNLAVKGATENSSWIGPLLLDLASFADPNVGESVAPWTVLPPRANRVTPRDDLYAFIVAHLALARLGCPLPDTSYVGDDPAAIALQAYGAFLYWSNRLDIDEQEKMGACRRKLETLAQSGRDAALDVICECEHGAFSGLALLPGNEPVVRSIWQRCPAEAASICRTALNNPSRQIGYFVDFADHNKHRNVSFAISVLKSFGNGSDRALLRQYAESSEYGEQSISALKSIEERLLRRR